MPLTAGHLQLVTYFLEWRGNGDNKGIRLLGMICDGEIPRFDGRLNEGAQPGLVDMDFSIFKGLHHSLIDIHSHNLDAVGSKGTGCGQANIA